MTSVLIAIAVVSADYYVEDYRARYVTDFETITAAIDAANPGDSIHFDGSRVYSPAKRIELYGETALGHGATIRRPDEWNAVLTQAARIGDTVIHVDAVPSDIVFRNHITLVDFGAGGSSFPHKDGMDTGGEMVQTWDRSAGTIELQSPIDEVFPAGSPLFRVDNLMTFSTAHGGSADNFIFDGNRANNDSHLSWVYGHSVMSWRGNGSITNSIFKNQPGQAVYIYRGSDFQVENNLFHDMNSSAMHFSSTYLDTGTVDFRNNVIVRSNEQADRVGHSQGVVTISYRNDRIRIEDNLAIDVDKPFIGDFSPEMYDWEVTGNELYDVDGLAFGRFYWGGPDPSNFVFTGNYCQDCDITSFEGTANTFGVGIKWRDLHFRDNHIVDGTMALDEVASGSIDGLTISACDLNPVKITDSMVAQRNITTSIACRLKRDDAAEFIYDPSNGHVTLDLTGTPHGNLSEGLMVLSDGDVIRFSGDLVIPRDLDVQTDILAARWTDSAGNYGDFLKSEGTSSQPAKIFTWNSGAGDWSDPSNWEPNSGPPAAGDAAVIDSLNTVVTVSEPGLVAFSTDVLAGELLIESTGMLTSSITVNGGKLKGNGGVEGIVINQDGAVAPGDGLGKLTIQGTYAQYSNGTLAIELAGANSSVQYDQLDIDGIATLTGILDITTDPNFLPHVGSVPGVIGDTFVVLVADTIDGSFSKVLGEYIGDGQFLLPIYNATDVRLGAYQALEGDVDGDRDIDITDFNVLATQFDPIGANSDTNDWEVGDFDEDGDVDITDFNALATNYVPSGYAGGTSSIPEPSSMTLLLLAMGAIMTRVFQRKTAVRIR